jgi:hypothetical protein
MRRIALGVAGSLVIAAGAFASVGVATAGAPTDHTVTICHATPPDTAANGWQQLSVDVSSVGYQQSGHQDQHDADIIPPYDFGDFSFAGKNWDATGQAIWNNGCVVPETPTSEETTTPTTEEREEHEAEDEEETTTTTAPAPVVAPAPAVAAAPRTTG